jgi:hypothetical protein
MKSRTAALLSGFLILSICAINGSYTNCVSDTNGIKLGGFIGTSTNYLTQLVNGPELTRSTNLLVADGVDRIPPKALSRTDGVDRIPPSAVTVADGVDRIPPKALSRTDGVDRIPPSAVTVADGVDRIPPKAPSRTDGVDRIPPSAIV